MYVFCGSSEGLRTSHAVAARCLGTAIAGRGLRLVYSGGRIELMRLRLIVPAASTT
jgi:predicted Rossmann-fold nucleotide-binding protein